MPLSAALAEGPPARYGHPAEGEALLHRSDDRPETGLRVLVGLVRVDVDEQYPARLEYAGDVPGDDADACCIDVIQHVGVRNLKCRIGELQAERVAPEHVRIAEPRVEIDPDGQSAESCERAHLATEPRPEAQDGLSSEL